MYIFNNLLFKNYYKLTFNRLCEFLIIIVVKIILLWGEEEFPGRED